MSRTTRLFQLMDALRGYRRPVTAARLAEQLGVSERTIYRDIQTLCSLGAPLEGAAGVGYRLKTGFFLPPLMFNMDELEALVLGARWVRAGCAARATPRSLLPPRPRWPASPPPRRKIYVTTWLKPVYGCRSAWNGSR